MINLAEVVTDPDFAQSFTLNRSSGSFGLGGWQDRQTLVTMYGVIQPATARDLEQLPEGDRVKGTMLFHSIYPMYTTHMNDGQAGISDVIQWGGDNWRIAYVWPWQDFGFYKAAAVRLEGG